MNEPQFAIIVRGSATFVTGAKNTADKAISFLGGVENVTQHERTLLGKWMENPAPGYTAVYGEGFGSFNLMPTAVHIYPVTGAN